MSISVKPALGYSLITDTDSYKLSHWRQYPPGTTQMMSYFESRGGEFASCTLFGLQYLLHEYLARPVTMAQVDEAASFARAHGVPFNFAGWQHIVQRHNGRLPVRIRALPEGTLVPTGNALMTIESLDPEVFWIVSWLETMLVRLWYPSTIARTGYASRQILADYLERTADDPQAELPFKLHDFGARGVSSLEQSRLGGAAHLLNFSGSDTIEGVRMANHYYGCDMAGFSIPASEHSTMTMWGAQREYDAFEAMIDAYLNDARGPGDTPPVAACVSDSYDLFAAISDGWCDRLGQRVKDSGGCLVIRPDSGEPVTILRKVFELLEAKVGMTVNSKGYKVLPSHFRVIQGDGIDRHSMAHILSELTQLGYSASNIAFGSGGGLLQKVDRDTQQWAFKCSAAKVAGDWVDVRKDPVTDPGKRSKAGRLDLIRDREGVRTVALDAAAIEHRDSMLATVFQSGDILVDTDFAACRARIGQGVVS